MIKRLLLKYLRKKNAMEFLTPGERIKKTRKMLKMKQLDLQGEKIKRNFVSMLETGERGLTKDTAKYLAEKFNNRASELGITLNIDDSYLLMSPKDEALKYCLDTLNSDITIEIINNVIEISHDYDLGRIEAEALLKKGNLYYNEKKYYKAAFNYIDALSKYGEIADNKFESYLFNKLGLCKLNELLYAEALEFFNKAYFLSKISNDLYTQKHSVYNISLCHRKLHKLDESIEYADKYLVLCNKSEDLLNYVYANVVKANCYRDLEKIEDAEKIYVSLLDEFSSLNDPSLAYVYDNLGLLYADIEEYDKAAESLDFSQKIRTETDFSNLDKSLIDKASILIKQKRYNEALILLNLGIDLATKFNDIEYELKGYYMLIEINSEIGATTELETTYIKILKIAEEKNDYKSISVICNKLCLMYLNNNMADKAIEFLKSHSMHK